MFDVNTEKKVSVTIIGTPPQLALHLDVDGLDVLDKFLILQSTLIQCMVTTQKNTITITGTLETLLQVTTQLHTVFCPAYINQKQKEGLDAELIRLNPAIEAYLIKKNLKLGRHGIFAFTGITEKTTTEKPLKKKSISARQSRDRNTPKTQRRSAPDASSSPNLSSK